MWNQTFLISQTQWSFIFDCCESFVLVCEEVLKSLHYRKGKLFCLFLSMYFFIPQFQSWLWNCFIWLQLFPCYFIICPLPQNESIHMFCNKYLMCVLIIIYYYILKPHNARMNKIASKDKTKTIFGNRRHCTKYSQKLIKLHNFF